MAWGHAGQEAYGGARSAEAMRDAVAAALGAGAEVSFTVTNSKISATDVVLVNHSSGGTAGAYMAQANLIADGSFKISVTNLTSGSESEAIVLSFVALKGASS